MNWIGLHIYFTSDKVKMFQECIIPLVDEMLEKGMAQSYFYIIYQEKGSHIRLRLKSAQDVNYIYNYTNARFLEHFTKYPSQPDSNRAGDFFPNDSVQLITYEPEYARYGGVNGIDVAEKQFRNSSDAVLYYFKKNKLHKYNDLLNLAIKLHLSSVYAYGGKKLEHAILFFNFLFNAASGLLNHSPFAKFTPGMEYVYSDYYNKQKHILVPYIKAIWESFDQNEMIDENIEQWKANEQDIMKQLNGLYTNNTLELPFLYESFPSWSILQSYVHMTNNRIGIIPTDEPMIAYLLMRGLKEI